MIALISKTRFVLGAICVAVGAWFMLKNKKDNDAHTNDESDSE